VSDQPHNATVEQGEEPLAGKRLAEGRRLREISIVEIAKELHLDEPRVRALEQNRFEVLGAPVFVKGYIRKYADIVGVSVDEVLADYAQFERRDEPPPIVGLRTRPPRDISPGPWLAAFLAIAVFAGGAWAWLSGSLDALFVAREQASLAPFETAAPAASDTAARAEPEPEPTESEFLTDAGRPSAAPAEPVDDDFAKAQDAPPVFEAPPAAPPGEGEVGLTVAFSGDCWTEVSDASGERLYFGLGQAGETMSVVGTAPLHVLLGDSEHATVQVDGEAFPIPRSARRGDTARLTINTR
jgi:cytoskeleton protein RodZ